MINVMLRPDRTERLEKLIDRFENLKKDLLPTEEKLSDELKKVKQQIADRARARTSFTGDPLKDLSIFIFGNKFKENYEQLIQIKDSLKNAEGEFMLIHDTSYNLLINVMKEADRCYIPFRVAALGIIDSNPLDVGYEHDITGDKYYLELRFKDGIYIRELELVEHPKLDKWLNILPTFRGREERYTEKRERLKLVIPVKDYESSEDYIRRIYVDYQEPEKYTEQDISRTKAKRPYWRVVPDRFDTALVTIKDEPAIEIFEEQEFPKKKYKVFALYIGNEEVEKRVNLDLIESGSIQKIYDRLHSSRGKPEGKTLIF